MKSSTDVEQPAETSFSSTSSSPQSIASDVSNQIWNVPNTLSLIRLVMAFAVGILIEIGMYRLSAVLFIVAVLTDAVDGWWARRFNQVTKLGRILDPFVDKIIITAALVALTGTPNSQVSPWMVTLIIGREFLVTSLRAMIEGAGGDFSARQLGKLKMVFQCLAVVSSLCLLAMPYPWLMVLTLVLMWLAVIVTVASGADYVVKAIELARKA
ncbi:MAG: CDP-diacylglycerol--glycerol-3-phosphate 3-phosphatidyltransferase [bacterium]|nr:CDP-diacylglycerol--glycerol-3-phosphate 3-phosphatidyltransferase [bacterium]